MKTVMAIKKTNRNITIKDIARKAGVSPTTVSFYLNGKADKFNIAQTTRQKIKEIVKKYNYAPNFHARAMLSQKTFLVGVLVSSIEDSFWNQIIAGVNQVLEQHDYHMILTESRKDSEREQLAFDFMAQKGVDGYIYSPVMIGMEPALKHPQTQLAGKPLVSILHPVENVPGVFTDHTAGGKIVAESLYFAGHRKVAYLGPVSDDLTQRDDERFLSFSAYYAKHNITIPHFDTIDKCMKELHNFTAVFCYSDTIAALLMLAAQRQKIKIPDDISIVGYGKLNDIYPFLEPRLTTVYEYKKRLGGIAAQRILQLINGEPVEPENFHFKLAPYIVEGKSVCKC